MRNLTPDELTRQIVHLPKPADLGTDRARRVALLEGIEHLILVGSPRRARRVAELAHERFGAPRDAAASCYCDLMVPGRDETGREYAVYGVELAGGARLAVVSHGIGKAGVEIVLSELPALMALLDGGRPPRLRVAIRCGTRGTLSPAPSASVALSTRCCDETLAAIEPDPGWLDRLRAAGRARGMTRVADDEIDRRSDWPADPTTILAEGPGISTSFFWQGQGRPLYRAGRRDLTPERLAREHEENVALLERWLRAGIRWIEMEDYTVLRIAAICGIPAVTVGAVLAQRRRADGSFQVDYQKDALALAEMIPAELALRAIASRR